MKTIKFPDVTETIVKCQKEGVEPKIVARYNDQRSIIKLKNNEDVKRWIMKALFDGKDPEKIEIVSRYPQGKWNNGNIRFMWESYTL